MQINFSPPSRFDFLPHVISFILVKLDWIGVTNAFMEEIKSVFSASKRKAHGYRSTTHLIITLYFVALSSASPQF